MQELDWDDVRLFLVVLRQGSFTAAARRAKLDHSTIARRLAKLEAHIGARLLHRSPTGVELTEAGLLLASHAERIEQEIVSATARLDERDGEVAGTVRLATPEAFGTYLVAPAMRRLYEQHPKLQLELVPESRTVSLSKREADIAVTLTRPMRGHVVARKLTDYRLGLYAAKTYSQAHAPIREASVLRDHPLVWYIDEMIDVPELRYLDQVAKGSVSVFRSSSIAAQHAAVANGLGLAVLHVFAAEADARLERILPEKVEVTRSYWLVYHRDDRQVTRIRAVVDFLVALIKENQHRF